METGVLPKLEQRPAAASARHSDRGEADRCKLRGQRAVSRPRQFGNRELLCSNVHNRNIRLALSKNFSWIEHQFAGDQAQRKLFRQRRTCGEMIQQPDKLQLIPGVFSNQSSTTS